MAGWLGLAGFFGGTGWYHDPLPWPGWSVAVAATATGLQDGKKELVCLTVPGGVSYIIYIYIYMATFWLTFDHFQQLLLQIRSNCGPESIIWGPGPRINIFLYVFLYILLGVSRCAY